MDVRNAQPRKDNPMAHSQRKPIKRPGNRAGRPRRLDVLRGALNHLDDPIWLLTFSPLIKLPVVQDLAARLGPATVCAEGRSLRAVLRRALRDVVDALDRHPVGVLAAGILAGQTQLSIAHQLGMTDEHLCRRYKPVLIELVGQRLASLSNDGGPSAEPSATSRVQSSQPMSPSSTAPGTHAA